MKLVAPIVPSAEEIEDLEKATQSAAEVTNTMLSQRLELEEKKRTISMLQKALVIIKLLKYFIIFGTKIFIS
jgi:hypothetical protein